MLVPISRKRHKSYFDERDVIVKTIYGRSRTFVKRGVLQGFVFGPLL